MANTRKAASRARNGMDQREPGHREARYAGEGYDSDGQHGDGQGYSGSPAHVSMTHGPGPVPGAGQLDGIGAPGPGRAGRSVRPDSAENPTRKAPRVASSEDDGPGDGNQD